MARLPYLIGKLRIELLDTSAGFELYQLWKIVLCLAVLLVPTTCLGFGLPLVARIRVRDVDKVGGVVGETYAWNTFGNVLGAILTSVLLLPALGLLQAFHLHLGLNLIAGLALLSITSGVSFARRTVPALAAVAIASVYLLVGTGWVEPLNFARNHLALRSGPSASLDAASRAKHPATSFDAWKDFIVASERPETVLFFDEDAHTTVLVAGTGDHKILYVNGKPDASNLDEDLETQLLLAHAPLFLALETRSLLVIGFGSGITLGAALQHPVVSVDLVEISRSVLAADQIFASYNHGAKHDPRVRIYHEDGQSFLRTTPRSYDTMAPRS